MECAINPPWYTIERMYAEVLHTRNQEMFFVLFAYAMYQVVTARFGILLYCQYTQYLAGTSTSDYMPVRIIVLRSTAAPKSLIMDQYLTRYT